jgi:hypothetical protein
MPAIVLVLVALAADPQQAYRGSGYAYFTTGACQHSYVIAGGGGGAEVFLWKGLTLGVEGGYQTFVNDQSYGDLYLPVGYHFRRSAVASGTSKWDPFFSVAPLGLYANGNRYNGTGAAGHLGGGATYWFTPRVGLRLEFRTHVLYGPEITAQVRVGVTFRP